jgi:serine/threonine protein kinase
LHSFKKTPLIPLAKLRSKLLGESKLEDKYTRGSTLGSGAFGEVYNGTDKKTGKECIIKVIKGNNFTNQYTELKILKKLNKIKDNENCKYTTCFVEYLFDKDGNLCIVYKKTYSKTLGDYMFRDNSTEFLKKVFKNTITGLKMLHSNNIEHADIKPANILANDAGEINYIDFGVSCNTGMLDLGICNDSVVGTPGYISPELTGIRTYIPTTSSTLKKADVWALGVTLYQLVYGRVPDKSNPSYNEAKNIYNYILKKMLVTTPSKRAKISELYDTVQSF